jgi:hypothetical protein
MVDDRNQRLFVVGSLSNGPLKNRNLPGSGQSTRYYLVRMCDFFLATEKGCIFRDGFRPLVHETGKGNAPALAKTDKLASHPETLSKPPILVD